MNNIFNSYDSENDERLDKKFSYNYQVIKNAYPKVSELPEDEVREIIRKYYDATGTHEDSMQAVMNYIHEKEPEWKRLYFNSNDDHNIFGNVFTDINVTNTPLLGKEGKNKLLPLFFDELNKINPAYRMGDAAGTLHAAKQDMDAHNLINSDNYYHRLGMCLNGQKGIDTALYSFAAGLAKEGYDLAIKNYDDYKNNNFSWKNFKNHVKDSMKDIKNNYESSIYGLTNPDENCRVWLKDLDINTNKWKNK